MRIVPIARETAVRRAQPVRQRTRVIAPQDVTDPVPVEIVVRGLDKMNLNTARLNILKKQPPWSKVVDDYRHPVSVCD